ncbi:hypothetical protein CTAYLR_007824 [Chrysophaeum taylorii]|uniref:HMG box domain-containing protein n=1 Tax=Chrysophaeum taylorii TaxID=2483200 RepID=A0AAD7UC96_9STRA|nr:hypothetical protein CTAYLR_007824 [Chrysophaeum taylorii]
MSASGEMVASNEEATGMAVEVPAAAAAAMEAGGEPPASGGPGEPASAVGEMMDTSGAAVRGNDKQLEQSESQAVTDSAATSHVVLSDAKGGVEETGEVVAQQKKKKKRKASTNAAPGTKRPKRPKTAYHFFYDIRRAEMIADLEAKKEPVDNNRISQLIGEEWKTVKDKTKYEAMAATAKVDYDKAVAAYEATGASMDDCQPKKPLSAYMLFFQAKHAQTPEASVTDFAKETGRQWKELGDDDKAPFLQAAKRQRDFYEAQMALMAKTKTDLVGATFVDSCASGRNARVETYDEEADTYKVVYDDEDLDDDDDAGALADKATSPICLAELRARVCGDEKAAKKFHDSATKALRRRKRELAAKEKEEKKAATKINAQQQQQRETTAPPVLVVDKGVTAGKKESVLADEEMWNVVRISRRLIGGACVQNLKKMCAAVGVSVGGSKSLLGTRLEHYLRDHHFQDHPFEPSARDVQELSIDDFNEKYENQIPHTIDDIVALLADIHKDDDEEDDEDDPVAPAPAPEEEGVDDAPADDAAVPEAPAAPEQPPVPAPEVGPEEEGTAGGAAAV